MNTGTDTTTVSPTPDDDSPFERAVALLMTAHGGITLFSVKEAAEILRMSEDFVRRKVGSQDINASRIGDRIFIHITEIARIQLEGLK